MLENNLETLFNEGFLEKNNLDPLKKGLEQAKDERTDNPRSAQRWIADIDKKNSGKKQRDLFLVVDKTKDEINANPNSDGTI